jgi:hypothetical protein
MYIQKNPIKTLGIIAMSIYASLLIQPSAQSYESPGAAGSVCRSYRAKNPSVGRLINAYGYLNYPNRFTCDFSNVSVMIDRQGRTVYR